MQWSKLHAPSLDDIDALARAALATLPEPFRSLLDGVACAVQEFPDEETLREMDLESPFDLMGLYHGADWAARQSGQEAHLPTMIFLYRRPILDYWAEHEESLEDVVRHVFIHEIGHHLGLSDEAMEAIENREDGR